MELRHYTQDEIEELIVCPKFVSEPPRKEMRQDRGHFRNDMRLKSTDEKYEFRVFIRRNEDFPENFSIGLAFLPKDGTGELILLRCNGPHGAFNDHFDPEHPHFDFHVHRASASMIEAGLRAEKFGEVNRDFASYEEALQYFVRNANITDARTYFGDTAQGKLRLEE